MNFEYLPIIWMNILSLFGKKPLKENNNKKYAERYADINDINYTAIFANKIATLATTESTLTVSGDTKRADLLNDIACRMWNSSKRIAARILGVGGVALVPYVLDSKLHYTIVPQSRLFISETTEDNITSATFLAQTITKHNTTYYRWVDYTLENGICTIKNKATDGSSGHDVLDSVSEWKDITPEIKISNCEKVLFAFVKSPVDNRKETDLYGVPITYGCDAIIDEIKTCLVQIAKEYNNKAVRLGIDSRMLGKDDIVPDFYIKLKSADNTPLFETFSPEIRDSSYYNRLSELYMRLEKAVGTSKGIISDNQITQTATATAVKRSNADTIALIENLRDTILKGVDNFLYSCNVLANYFNLTPPSDYGYSIDWFDPFEDPSEQWQRMKEGKSMGVIKEVEIRQWIKPSESAEDAQKAIDEIKQSEPPIAQFVGTNNS